MYSPILLKKTLYSFKAFCVTLAPRDCISLKVEGAMMKKILFVFLCSLVCTYSIHSAKPETAQAPEEKSTKKNFRKQRRLKNKPTNESQKELEQKQLPDLSFDESPLQIFQAPPPLAPDDEKLCMMISRIEFTHEGMTTFFNNSFNRKEYGQDFLPHNFSHLIQFLSYAHEAQQPKEFYDGVLRLFNQKLKACPFVNATALERMLTKSTPYFEHIFPHEEQSLWKEIKKSLWQNFRNKFAFLTSDPMGFFEDVSDEIIKKVKINATTPDRLRSMIVRFVGTALDKTVWCPDDKELTWKSFKTLGAQIAALHEKNILTDEYDLNDLYWSLIERYCNFLELSGSALSLEACELMKADLINKKINWIQLAEQEEGIETKQERLAQALLETEAKVRIRKEGIITDLMPQTTRL